MRKCKECGVEYSLWEARGDGLCIKCGGKQDKEIKDKQIENANNKIGEIISQMAPDDEIEVFGLATWETKGANISSTFNLWVGRFLFGILGDILHSKIKILGIIALSRTGFLYTAKIGEVAESGKFDPSQIINSRLIVKSVTKTPIDKAGVTPGIGTFTATLSGNKTLNAKFPTCFIKRNNHIPNRIIDAWNKQKKTNSA